MPNRIIKESIRTSKTVNKMTDFQFRMWVYLITYVDDYGRGSADPELIKGFVFPRRNRITESDINKTLAELAGMGCINLYDVDGESFFCFPNWGEHQRIQTKKSKFPEPQPKNGNNDDPQKVTVTHGDPPPESNPNPNPNPIQEDTRAFCEAVTTFLNQKANTAYRASSKKTRELILARKNEGFTLDDFKTVIAKKAAEWGKEPEKGQKDMRPYLRPETLFGTKFESYLNQPVGKGRNTPKSSQSYDLEEFERYSLQFTPDVDDGGDSE